MSVESSEPDQPTLAAALGYAAEFGWRAVILHGLSEAPGGLVCSCGRPACSSGGKHPRARNWPEAATSDPDAIRRLWKEGSNVGVALGSRSGIVAIDVDPPGGEGFLAALADGDLPPTLELTTGKGRSLLYAIPDGLDAEPKTTCYQDADGHESIRLQSTGAQRVLPPSRHPSGRQYAWVPGRGPGEIEPAPMPGWLIREMIRPDEPPRVDTEGGPARDGTPWADFNRRGSWDEVLSGAGAKPFGRRAEVAYWTRPGKSGGISASVGYCRAKDGTPALYVWSGNWAGLAAGKCYDLYGAYARLVHGGDFQAAARALMSMGYGKPPRRPGGPGEGQSGKRQPHAQPDQARANDDEKPKPWANSPGGSAPRGVTLAQLERMDFPPIRFVVPGLIGPGLTVLAGRPKSGKSWLALLTSWSVAAGHDLDGRRPDKGEVLYLALEDQLPRLKDRAMKLKQDLGWEMPNSLHVHILWPRASDGGLYWVADWLEAHKGAARLVVVDVLQKFRRPQKGNANNYSDDYEAVGGLKDLVDHYKVSGLFLHHTRKMRAEDPFDELSGTYGISGPADTLCMLDTVGSSAKLYVRGRDIPESTIPLKYTLGSGRWIFGQTVEGVDSADRLPDPSKKKESPARARCETWLKERLAGGAQKLVVVVADALEAGHTEGTIFRTIEACEDVMQFDDPSGVKTKKGYLQWLRLK